MAVKMEKKKVCKGYEQKEEVIDFMDDDNTCPECHNYYPDL